MSVILKLSGIETYTSPAICNLVLHKGETIRVPDSTGAAIAGLQRTTAMADAPIYYFQTVPDHLNVTPTFDLFRAGVAAAFAADPSDATKIDGLARVDPATRGETEGFTFIPKFADAIAEELAAQAKGTPAEASTTTPAETSAVVAEGAAMMDTAAEDAAGGTPVDNPDAAPLAEAKAADAPRATPQRRSTVTQKK